MHHWVNRVFAFPLAILEVNAFLAFRFFIWDSENKFFLSGDSWLLPQSTTNGMVEK
jgi:hypothetical protein